MNIFKHIVYFNRKNYSSEYWQNASSDVLTQEFQGQKNILAKFAQVAEADIKGVRTPLLEINGDKTFTAIEKSGLTYDNTWTTVKLDEWPYTLNFESKQDCLLGYCPKDSHKGKWVIPIVDWRDATDLPCATVQGCINR